MKKFLFLFALGLCLTHATLQGMTLKDFLEAAHKVKAQAELTDKEQEHKINALLNKLHYPEKSAQKLLEKKEALLELISPSQILALSINNWWRTENSTTHQMGEPEDDTLALKLELANILIEDGADINYNWDGFSFLITAINYENLDLAAALQENGAHCSSGFMDEMLEGGLADYLVTPNYFLNQKYKNLGAKEGIEIKVPHTIHHIWLTHPSAPREVREQDIQNAIKNKELFAQSKAKWTHIVWTNNLDLIPNSVKTLEAAGIQVKSIYEHQNQLKLFNLIEELIENQGWGKASDTLRYSLLYQFGGLYADINFIFNRDPTSESYKYNFFSMTFKSLYIDNFFFGSSPEHPILGKTLELVERNLINPPQYIASIANQASTTITDMTTAKPIYLGYYSEANKNGNVDVVYPLIDKDQLASDDEDSAQAEQEYIDKFIKNLERFCTEPHIKPYIEVVRFIQENEVCGSDEFHIGEDSSDGKTWVN